MRLRTVSSRNRSTLYSTLPSISPPSPSPIVIVTSNFAVPVSTPSTRPTTSPSRNSLFIPLCHANTTCPSGSSPPPPPPPPSSTSSTTFSNGTYSYLCPSITVRFTCSSSSP